MDAALRQVAEVSLRDRPGRRFEPGRERLLDTHLRDLALRLPGASEGLVLGVEVSGPRGVADLVAVTRGLDQLSQRARADLPYLDSVADCEVVSATAVLRTLTTESIARSLGQTPEQVTRRLAPLVRSGHLLRVGSGYRRHPAMVAAGNAYAFEAKVRDWRKGISQALRYGAWCDASAVVLLEKPRNWSEAIDRCDALGVGLAFRSSWAVRPRLRTPTPGLRLALSEQIAHARHRPSAEA